jgi:integrase/recombinase XerD
VTGFVRRECARRGVASAKATVTGLRSLLRFLYLDGQITAPLAGAVPSAACWQLAALPRAVSPADLARLMGSCDRDSAAGRRDLAILVLLARLGLRAGEVAALDLGDICWRQGEITVRGKGSRRDILPLPVDAGEAVAGWLAGGRPPGAACPAVFVRLRPPHGRLASLQLTAPLPTLHAWQVPEGCADPGDSRELISSATTTGASRAVIDSRPTGRA